MAILLHNLLALVLGGGTLESEILNKWIEKMKYGISSDSIKKMTSEIQILCRYGLQWTSEIQYVPFIFVHTVCTLNDNVGSEL
jgi:hypothetical protein